ncbi:ABC transporter ATP-binding protein [Parapusillimonas granuli]|uniref:ABC transporter ATP-binding protein n=1 Tax=Parapusillimonas granuli TaxID=380911 RepID=A0A853FYZ5_9BURK|nr:ABC transporter ATP-binding protein [Parapusillimonas granuli]MBB5215490.1 ABC-type sugar transport system ATPase subunit [Parapusillimonas granuli]NYT49843.1 ABC transporter ATP-binding protein [Parapusillimonas granuli]
MSQSGSVKLENVVKRHGSFTALQGISLDIRPGEFFALLGPSGSGKTTTLRILAGLESVNEGRVLLDDVDVTHAQPGERDVAMVFQSYALYPHMTVAENIAFPLKMMGTPAATIEDAVQEAAAKVGIGRLLSRRPGQLSGGQQQRCALARAIVRKPRLFLLDEPLSNLDAKLRVDTRAELRRLQRSLGVTTVYVTHDQEEAMTVADRIAVFMEGRIVQVGTPKEVFLRPANAVVAAFIGTPPMNLMPAKLAGGQVRVHGAGLPAGGAHGLGERDVTLGLRPGDLRIADQGIPARVEFIEDLGDSVIAIVTVGDQHMKMRLDQHAVPQEGQQVFLSFAPAAAHLFDRQTGERLPSD